LRFQKVYAPALELLMLSRQFHKGSISFAQGPWCVKPWEASRLLVGTKRKWLRWTLRIAGATVVLLGLVALFWLRGALYHRFVLFPREEKAWQALRAQRRGTPDYSGWTEFRGILHSHSKLSHDCEVPFEEILRVLKATRIDFICLSDHPVQGRADFDLQWRGSHEGKLFIPGYEMKEGIMPFGVAQGVVLSNQTDSSTLAKQIDEKGGLLFYAHSEEPREWNRQELVGMEIYNIHTDFKRRHEGLGALLPDTARPICSSAGMSSIGHATSPGSREMTVIRTSGSADFTPAPARSGWKTRARGRLKNSN
jgi:hypothetical protein